MIQTAGNRTGAFRGSSLLLRLHRGRGMVEKILKDRNHTKRRDWLDMHVSYDCVPARRFWNMLDKTGKNAYDGVAKIKTRFGW